MNPGTPPRIAVAYSGGRDSTALLHVVARMATGMVRSLHVTDTVGPTHGPAAPLEVVALHVHHGLQPQADDWLAHCQAQCEAWTRAGLPVTFASRRLALCPGPGESVEAIAREARYDALAAMAREQGASLIALAHHRRDQAETFILQALRGAGADGLSSMPASIVRDGLTWVRPWLNEPREAIEAYVRQHGLVHVDDNSNTDERYLRNRLRRQVWPALKQAFPGAERSLSDAARHAQDGRECAEALARIDLATVTAPHQGRALDVGGLLGLSPARRRNVLRVWYRDQSGRVLPATATDRLCDELTVHTHGAQWPVPGQPGCVLRVHRDQLTLASRLPATASAAVTPVAATMDLSMPDATRFEITPWGGTLHLAPVTHAGVARALLREVRCVARCGGEQFQFAPGRPARQLKKQYQALGVPAWQRGGPLLYVGEQLVFVPGLGIDARVWAGRDEPDQVSLRWEPAAPG